LNQPRSELLPLAVADTAWHIVGTGDFDRDGRRDLFWRHQIGGELAVWLMDGTSVLDGRLLPFVVDPVWHIRAIADVDGNWSLDLIWQRDGSGQPSVWLMDGLTLLSGGTLGTSVNVDSTWRVVGPK
jgi:hypothetical protein